MKGSFSVTVKIAFTTGITFATTVTATIKIKENIIEIPAATNDFLKTSTLDAVGFCAIITTAEIKYWIKAKKSAYPTKDLVLSTFPPNAPPTPTFGIFV